MSKLINILVYKATAPNEVLYMIKLAELDDQCELLVIGTSIKQLSIPCVITLPTNFVEVVDREEFKIENSLTFFSYLFQAYIRDKEDFYQEDLFEYIQKHSTVEQRDQYAEQGYYSCENTKSVVKNCAHGIWTHVVKGEGDDADEVITDMEPSCYFCGKPEDCK